MSNLRTIYESYKFIADCIINFDESCISTVLETPRVLALKTQKQWQILSGESDELVTSGGIILATENIILPVCAEKNERGARARETKRLLLNFAF